MSAFLSFLIGIVHKKAEVYSKQILAPNMARKSQGVESKLTKNRKFCASLQKKIQESRSENLSAPKYSLKTSSFNCLFDPPSRFFKYLFSHFFCGTYEKAEKRYFQNLVLPELPKRKFSRGHILGIMYPLQGHTNPHIKRFIGHAVLKCQLRRHFFWDTLYSIPVLTKNIFLTIFLTKKSKN